MTVKAQASFTATAGRMTSPEFNDFFDKIGMAADKGIAWVTYMPGPIEGVFAYGPDQIGNLEHSELFSQLAEAAKAASA